MVKKKIFISVILLLKIILLYPQSPVFRHYTVDDGLPSSEIYHAIQDSKGYIWFATNFGASRFDGYKFENFDLKDGLLNNTILEIYEDYKGRVWFIPISSELSYFFNGKIYKYSYNDKIIAKIKTRSTPIKLSFRVDEHDNVRIGHYGCGLMEISCKGVVRKLYDPVNARYLVDIKNKKYNLSSETNQSTKIFIRDEDKSYTVQDALLGIPDLHGLYYMSLKPDNTIFLSTGLLLMNIKNGSDYDIIRFSDRIIWMGTDKNALWVGTGRNGVYYYETGNIRQKARYNFLKGMGVSSVLVDREGSYWFTTIDNGVYFTPSLNFLTYTTTDGLTSDKVNSVSAKNNDSIWFSTSNNYLSLLHSEKVSNTLVSESPRVNISSVYYDTINRFPWICTDEYLYKFKNKKITQIKNNFLKSHDHFVKAKKISLSRDGKYLIAKSFGVSFLRNDIITYNSGPGDGFNERTSTVVEDPDGTLWVGCINGLWHFKNGHYENYGNKHELLKSSITDIKIDRKNRIWLATKGAGILVFDRKNIYRLTRQDGLANNSVTSLYMNREVMWAGTAGGLNKVQNINENTDKFKIQGYYKYDGLASIEINSVFAHETMVWVATNKGLTVFNDTAFHENKERPPVYVTNVKVLNQPVDFRKPMELGYNQSFLSFEFVGLTFKTADKTIYKYRLEGLDSAWYYTTSTVIQYPYLPHGKYCFRVYAKNNHGYFSMYPASVLFQIYPPFWKTWWFLTLVVLTASGILYLIYKLRINEINKRNKLKDELNRYMQQALTKQMNPHFIFNSLNSIQRFILDNDKRESTKYLSKFSRLMRIVLDNSQNQTVTIEQELNALNLYLELEALRFMGKFEYSINLADEIDREIQIPALLIQPYVENAIWHGIMHKPEKYGKVTINFMKEQDYIRCVITDDGIGREQSKIINERRQKTHKSYGLSITEKRLQIFNSLYGTEVNVNYTDLHDADGKPCGTSVELKIAVQEN